MNDKKIIIAILTVILIFLCIYTAVLLEDSMNNADNAVTNGANKNSTTINESDPNGTNGEIESNDANYQAYNNDYGAEAASSN